MEKKKKIFYIDFIRVISMLMIVTYHFFAHFPENNIVGANIIFSNGKWGLIGVALFFMISGASLMYNYKEKLEIKSYAKKRFIGIYPMFWIAYISIFIYIFYCSKQSAFVGSPLKLIISLFAMDGYLSSILPTFYLIGEWFLGCIVLIYVLFPILRIIVNKYPKPTIIIATIINLLVLLFYKNGIIPINQNLIVSVYSFILGMYLINVKEFQLWQAGIGLVLAITGYMLPASNMNIQVLFANFAAYSLFIVLAYIGQKISNLTIQKIFSIIGKYSYAVFLVHHYIIMKIENTFQNQTYGIFGTMLLYFTVWFVIIIFAKILYMANKGVLNVFKNEEKKIEKGA